MNKSELIELLKKHGRARTSLNPADTVLVDGSGHGGEYVTLCKVLSVKAGIVTLQEEHTYYMNGGEYPERKVSSVSLDYFQKNIADHILEGREVFKQIAEAFEREEEN